MSLNLGTTSIIAIVASTSKIVIATAVAVDRTGFLSIILIRAQVAKIGALVKICNHCTIAH
jgi:hypothetical protein